MRPARHCLLTPHSLFSIPSPVFQHPFVTPQAYTHLGLPVVLVDSLAEITMEALRRWYDQ